MLTRLLVPALLCTALVTGTAFAGEKNNRDFGLAPRFNVADMTSRAQCEFFEAQFDKAIRTHQEAPKAADARVMRTEGADLCKSGKQSEGVVKLKTALNDIGVTPRT